MEVRVKMTNNSIRRTQSSNVQIIKIIQPGDARTVGRNHRNISKVTLASEPSERPGLLRKRYNSVACSSSVNVTTIKSCNENNDKMVEEMKTSIMKMMEDKETIMRENSTLRRYKESVESLSEENARLKQELSKLKSIAECYKEINNNTEQSQKVNLSDLEKWLLSSSQSKSATCDKCNENVFTTPENNVKKCNTSTENQYLQSITRELLILFLFSKLKS